MAFKKRTTRSTNWNAFWKKERLHACIRKTTSEPWNKIRLMMVPWSRMSQFIQQSMRLWLNKYQLVWTIFLPVHYKIGWFKNAQVYAISLMNSLNKQSMTVAARRKASFSAAIFFASYRVALSARMVFCLVTKNTGKRKKGGYRNGIRQPWIIHQRFIWNI